MTEPERSRDVLVRIESLEVTKSFSISIRPDMTLLEALSQIQETMDPSVAFRWSCRSGHCGICAVLVNGAPKLACQERIGEAREITVAPIGLTEGIGSLVCRISDVYAQHFLTSRFLLRSEPDHKQAFEQLLLESRDTASGPTLHVWQDGLPAFRQCLLQLVHYPWFEKCFRQTTPGTIPQSYPGRQLLLTYGLINGDGRAQYRVNRIRDCVFVTTGPWEIHASGVFPFSDESELLLDYIEEHGIDRVTGGIVDVACGCGHTVIAYWGSGARFALDSNPAAEHFVALNAAVNQRQLTYVQNDISAGLPETLERLLPDSALFVINMPHALSPEPGLLPSTSDGGRTGLGPTLSALKALRKYVGNGGVVVVLCYSLGNRDLERWQILLEAERLFPNGRLEWKVLPNTRIWRVNGKKDQPNPMPLREGLPTKADCRLYVRTGDRRDIKRKYTMLAEALEREGWDVLGCGILTVHL